MNQAMVNTIIGAVVGAVIGAGVVFFTNAGKTEFDLANIDKAQLTSLLDLENLEVRNLRVQGLVISDHAVLLNAAGVPEVVLREGSILAENVIIAKKLVGQQLQGHAIVANRLFTTPDDLIRTPMEEWRFFAEIGASNEAGGEIVIRSANGAASVNQATLGGALIRVGYDTDTFPQIVALHNSSGNVMQINYDLSEQQKQMVASSRANPQAQAVMPPQGTFDSPTAAPFNPNPEMIPSAALNDPNMVR